MTFLRQAAARPRHAYLLAGPGGRGKSLAAARSRRRCSAPTGVRDVPLHRRRSRTSTQTSSSWVRGRDIHVETVKQEIWHPAYRTAPEPVRKVFVIRTDRLGPRPQTRC